MIRFYKLFLFTILFSSLLFAQKTVVEVQDFFDSGGSEGTLNAAVQSAIDDGTLSNTIFKLKPYGVYVLDGTITTPAGAVLDIEADPPGNTQETAPPMICWTASTAPSKTYIFDVAGELKMKNIWILWASLDGTRYNSTIRIGDSATVSGGRITADNVLFDYVQQNSSGAVQPYATHFIGHFNNCYFRNATDVHFRYYSRAVSVPYAATGLHIDTVSFENCTFANIGYVYMQEAGVYGDNVFFNHCTFLDVVMYPLESGWWHRMYVTNSLFINTFMYGQIPSAPGGFTGGTIAITPIDSSSISTGFGFEVPFTEQDRHVLFTNNNYYLQPWLIDWMQNCPYSKAKHQQRLDEDIPVPQPMFNGLTITMFDSVNTDGSKAWPYMNKANLDSLEPGFINAPINIDSLKAFLNKKWDDNTNIQWAWNFAQYDTNGGQKWPLREDLSYTNEQLKTGGMGGFPMGDLRWWPDQYSQWKAQASDEHNRINTWLETGKDPNAVGVREVKGAAPSEYKLNQNYPNPFNPTTKIEYSVPKSGYISLKVYDLLGQEVATIFSGNQKAGNYVATFDGSDLASGVYLYKLESDKVSITKKFVLMK
ncbi:MAG: T9SS type A sorting domain-containing protein [Ignavibacteriaceae bacterium]